jgi:hypothetical protein
LHPAEGCTKTLYQLETGYQTFWDAVAGEARYCNIMISMARADALIEKVGTFLTTTRSRGLASKSISLALPLRGPYGVCIWTTSRCQKFSEHMIGATIPRGCGLFVLAYRTADSWIQPTVVCQIDFDQFPFRTLFSSSRRTSAVYVDQSLWRLMLMSTELCTQGVPFCRHEDYLDRQCSCDQWREPL